MLPLELASHAGDLEKVQQLIASGANLREQLHPFGCLGLALKHFHYDVARILLDQGADPESLIWGGPASAIFASVELNPTALRLLAEYGANMLWTSPLEGSTLLHRACWGNDQPVEIKQETIEFLLASGINIDAVDSSGNTALHESIAGDGPDWVAVRSLLEHGAAIDLQNNSGQTPVILAAKWNARECLELLIQFGADFQIRDHQGCSALDAAKAKVQQFQTRLLEWERETKYFSSSPFFEEKLETWCQGNLVRLKAAEECFSLLETLTN